jgi:hypothetical protein
MSWEQDDEFSWQLAFDPEKMRQKKLELASFVLPPCGLQFVDDHFGPRPGCLHTLLGSTGRGKSTLVQSLLLEWARNAAVALYLSEESIERVEYKLFEKEVDPSYLSPNLFLIHERDMLKRCSAENISLFMITLRTKLEACKAKMLIIDNLTTSQFYEGNIPTNAALLAKLRDLADQMQIPIFLIAHTKKGVNETTKGIILPDDVRGSAVLPNTSDYFYTFYRVRHTSETGSARDGAFVWVNKSRDHENQDKIYRLDYNVHSKRYIADSAVDFNIFKEAMRDRDRA